MTSLINSLFILTTSSIVILELRKKLVAVPAVPLMRIILSGRATN